MPAPQLPVLKEVEHLSPRVIRILGGNPGKFTLQGTNTYLVGTGSNRILIDSAHGFEEWATSLSSVLAAEKATVSECLLTHWHPDHVLGVPDLLKLCPDVKIYKHKSMIPSLVQVTPKENASSKPQAGVVDENGIYDIQDGQVFVTEGASLTAIHSPGHTDDHIAFLLGDEDGSRPLWDPDLPPTAIQISDSGSVFAGDNVLGHGTSVFEDLALYISSLEKMREALQGPGMLYPAHGEVIKDGRAKIDEYVKHRRERETQVLGVLTSDREDDAGGRATQASWTPREITRVIYRGVDEGLLDAAERGVRLILGKLDKEGKIQQENDQWWATDRARF